MVKFARIPTGSGDSARCSLCAPRPQASYFPAEEVLTSIEVVATAQAEPTGPNLCLAAPEPFGHPELPRLVMACRKAGARRIALETDGAALSVRANAAGVIAAGVRHLHVRVLDVGERGDELVGSPGRTKDVLAGVAAYLEAAQAASVAVVVTLVVPVCTHNLASLPAIVSTAAVLGAHGVRLVASVDLPSSASALTAAACDTGMVNGVWVECDEHLPLPDTHRLHVVAQGACGE